MTNPSARRLERLVRGQATSDGAGVKLTRIVANELHQRLDPFLMLDAFGSDKAGDYIAGFPDHPHRGFETVTYMLHGRMRHRDSAGNEGLLKNGDVQWMTAGRGVIHSEMPEQEEGLMSGFQLWLNLPAKDKMCPPWYRDIPSGQVPEFTTDQGVTVRVIAGHSQGTDGSVKRDATQVLYLDLHFPEGASAHFDQTLPSQHNAMVYVYQGSVDVVCGEDTAAVPAQHLAILRNEGDHVRLSAGQGTRVLLLAGQPLREPIVQYGPFVMNTKEQIIAAMDDYRAGRLA